MKITLKKLEEEINRLKEYEKAFGYIVGCLWDLSDKENQREMNKELNKIFILNEDEKVDE